MQQMQKTRATQRVPYSVGTGGASLPSPTETAVLEHRGLRQEQTVRTGPLSPSTQKTRERSQGRLARARNGPRDTLRGRPAGLRATAMGHVLGAGQGGTRSQGEMLRLLLTTGDVMTNRFFKSVTLTQMTRYVEIC